MDGAGTAASAVRGAQLRSSARRAVIFPASFPVYRRSDPKNGLAGAVPYARGNNNSLGQNLVCYNFLGPGQARTKESQITMSSAKHKLRLAGAFAALATLALAVSCRGFFVSPTLSSIAVGPPTPTILTGTTTNTVQMTAFGVNNDGSTSNSPSVSWSLTPAAGVATISTSGLVTSVAIGTATVTATSNVNPTISGTQTVTVSVGCVTSISIQPTSGSVSNSVGTTVSLTANAMTCNGTVGVTSVANWASSNTNLATVSAGLVSGVAGLTTGGTVQITASIGNVTSNIATITVTP